MPEQEARVARYPVETPLALVINDLKFVTLNDSPQSSKSRSRSSINSMKDHKVEIPSVRLRYLSYDIRCRKSLIYANRV